MRESTCFCRLAQRTPTVHTANPRQTCKMLKTIYLMTIFQHKRKLIKLNKNTCKLTRYGVSLLFPRSTLDSHCAHFTTTDLFAQDNGNNDVSFVLSRRLLPVGLDFWRRLFRVRLDFISLTFLNLPSCHLPLTFSPETK